MGIVFNDVSYNGNNYSFDIEKSKITGIIGKSGSGKSDIVDLISGLCECDSGSVLCEGDVGIVYQNSDDQFYFDNVLDNFNFVMKIHNSSFDRIGKSLKMVGLDSSYLQMNYYELSLSERKLISFALAICFNPKILVLDDVFFGIGSDYWKIVKVIRMMKIRYGKTIVILSRNSDLIHYLCDDIILLGDGKVISKGDKYSVFTDYKSLSTAGVDVPSIIKFSKIMKKKLNKKIIYRDDVNDLAKDIYRLV